MADAGLKDVMTWLRRLACHQPDGLLAGEAADHIDSLTAENERLREALRSIAEMGGVIGFGNHAAFIARTALSPTDTQGKRE